MADINLGIIMYLLYMHNTRLFIVLWAFLWNLDT